ncbi:MAG: exodeoxyribonuclease VII large subunit [Spirochaetaceae bacterium]
MNLQDHLFSVTELNQVIKDILENSFYSINIEGEISNFKGSVNGHWYFTLKDKNSSLSAVMFKNSNYKVNFKPKDGMKVKIRGKLTLYSQRGTYQVVCDNISVFGAGDILVMLEERKRKLASLGFFDPSKKQSLPKIPNVIGIITSPTGAALQDILKVLRRRHSFSNIIILPTTVQGATAHNTISSQIIKANKDSLCDLIILSRGGGSMEDLLPFSEESVIREIYKSKIPIISGIGHEIDTTLSDLAADIRAATPSAAAEIATEASEVIYKSIKILKDEIIIYMKNKLLRDKNRLIRFDIKSELRHLNAEINNKRMYIDGLHQEIVAVLKANVEKKKNIVNTSKEIILSLSPFKLFDKGYSWVTLNNKNIIDTKIKTGDLLEINYKNGKIKTEMKEEL